jgi:hypothetical protein
MQARGAQKPHHHFVTDVLKLFQSVYSQREICCVGEKIRRRCNEGVPATVQAFVRAEVQIEDTEMRVSRQGAN